VAGAFDMMPLAGIFGILKHSTFDWKIAVQKNTWGVFRESWRDLPS
jgi:hypothetical protein